MRWVPALVLSLLAASCSDPPVSSKQVCCSAAGASILRNDACLAGEIGQSLDRCMAVATDAGNTCGNGQFEAATEQCDLSAAQAPACMGNNTCQGCQCVAAGVCGNGTVESGEQCETTTQCNNPTMVVCRSCGCVARQMPITFTDSSDSDRTNEMGRDLSRVEMALKAPPEDTFSVIASGPNGMGMIAMCLVFQDAATEVQRFCVREQPRMGMPATYSAVVIDSAGERALTRTTDYVVRALTTPNGKPGSFISVKGEVGLRFERALSFHWESLYESVLVDRLPDTGEISFTEIMGRE